MFIGDVKPRVTGEPPLLLVLPALLKRAYPTIALLPTAISVVVAEDLRRFPDIFAEIMAAYSAEPPPGASRALSKPR